MSALDDLLHGKSLALGYGAGDHNDHKRLNEAREELELLREAAFQWVWSSTASGHVKHLFTPTHKRILRTDPERARKMGLGWAL